MTRAGFEPTEAIAFWRRMQQLAGDHGPPAFLATHPSNVRRIEDQLRRIVQGLWPCGSQLRTRA